MTSYYCVSGSAGATEGRARAGRSGGGRGVALDVEGRAGALLRGGGLAGLVRIPPGAAFGARPVVVRRDGDLLHH